MNQKSLELGDDTDVERTRDPMMARTRPGDGTK